MNKRSIVRIGSVGFAISVFMFIIIIILLVPYDFADPVEETLKSQLGLSSTDHKQYTSIIPIHFALDTVLIIGWLIGWIGLSVLIQTRHMTLGRVVLVIGLIGPILDFVENEMAWAIIDSVTMGESTDMNWYIGWKIVRQLSYLIPFAAAPIASVGLWSRMPLNRFTALAGTFFVVIAIFGLYIPAMVLASQIWWLIWFTCLGLLLWFRSAELLLE